MKDKHDRMTVGLPGVETKRRGRPPKYATDEAREKARREQVRNAVARHRTTTGEDNIEALRQAVKRIAWELKRHGKASEPLPPKSRMENWAKELEEALERSRNKG
ncbi:hypothetical protein [Chitinimonas koreensis]|uniref:hypothetical protein n=1 Tax=Chitinimonas koreensis TaxID=356302 RepID=UPI0012F8FB53|nr:hypothetical protein [Chitinimonas koreensis]QNM98677.1 hypothetical protein H9L41_10905 [Chitinimonas koreensis]